MKLGKVDQRVPEHRPLDQFLPDFKICNFSQTGLFLDFFPDDGAASLLTGNKSLPFQIFRRAGTDSADAICRFFKKAFFLLLFLKKAILWLKLTIKRGMKEK